MAELREGFTTGTAAAAAAKAALSLLLGQPVADVMDTPLPGGGRLAVPLARCAMEGEAARGVVVKDGGDDPDATHGAEVHAVVRITGPGEGLRLDGGRGVGRVTRPGLEVPPGQAAINPGPQRQIRAAVVEVLEACGADAGSGIGTGPGIAVVIEVPDGEAIAERTLNPRLGIVGGISILGSSGIVRPYSHDAWKAAVAQGLDVARAAGLEQVLFATGRRSERLYCEHFPQVPEAARIQPADFFAFAMREAAHRGFARVVWTLFPGKLAKHAQGLEHTHAHTAPLDLDRLAAEARAAGADGHAASMVEQAATVRGALEGLEPDAAAGLLARLVGDAAAHARAFAGDGLHVDYAVFGFDGSPALPLPQWE